MNHKLEALLAGDSDPETEAHVARCEACQGYVQALEEERKQWDESAALERFSSRLKQAEPRFTNVRVLRWASAVSAPLLVAAALILYFRQPKIHTDPIYGVAPPACANCDPSTGPTRFKGAAQVFVIVQQGDVQTRSASEAVISSGAQLRVEVSVAGATPIAAGVLTTSGEFVPLLLPAELDAGTHYSEKAASFDDEPTEGWVIVGSPDAVRHAQRTRSTIGVTAIPLRYTRAP